MHPPSLCPATIVEIAKETPSIVRVVLDVGEAFTFLPGQWIDFAVELDGEEKVGGYSLASSPSALPRIELGIRISQTQRVSQWLHEDARPGDHVMIQGGSGDCVYTAEDGDDVTFVVGGIGITPPLSMLRSALEGDKAFKVRLFYSARTADELAFLADLRTLERDERFSLYTTVTQPLPGTDWAQQTGRWSLDSITSASRPNTIFYLFGPPQMVDQFQEALERSGVGCDQIRTERWW